MKLLILLLLVVTTLAAPAAQSLTFHEDGSYRFYYETGKEGGSHTRTEVRNPDGSVVGKYSYEDPDGEVREVNYRADQTGYVAHGDVGVKGAPKGQFPAVQADQPSEESQSSEAIADDQPPEPKQDLSPQHRSDDQSPTDVADDGPYHDEEGDKDDMQDLALEESASADDPPEAFPAGFFLEKFHGLRRLPEPTKEDKPATTEAPKVTDNQTDKPEVSGEAKDDEEASTESPATNAAPAEGSVLSFTPFKPFPVPGIPANPAAAIPEIPHDEWASAMFHQPVYVFAYHHPDAYGYHYYF